MGRQKWDPGENNVKNHIVLEVKSTMYQNIQKYIKMCKIEIPLKSSVFLMILNFWDPAFRSKIAQTLISIDSIEPPGTLPRIPRIPRIPGIPGIPGKWWHEVLLGAPLPHAPGVRMT